MRPELQDQAALQAATDTCLGADVRVLQLYQCGKDEAHHVGYLLSVMDPPHGACIVDVGCGVGEVARLMLEERGDLGFILLNLSEYQLGLCPRDIVRVQADMHEMPLMHGCADVVMVNYTLGYADLETFLGEAFRVLKPGGILFIYDLAHNRHAGSEPCQLMLDKFGYRVYSRQHVNAAANRIGFTLERFRTPPATPDHLAPLLDDEYRAVMVELASEALPTIWRFVKDRNDE